MHLLVATSDDTFQMDAFRAGVNAKDEVDGTIHPVGAENAKGAFEVARKHVPGVCLVDAEFTRQGGEAVLDGLVAEPFQTTPVLAAEDPWDVNAEQLPEDTILIDKSEDAVWDVLTSAEIDPDIHPGHHRVEFHGPVMVETAPIAELLDSPGSGPPRIRIPEPQVPDWIEFDTPVRIRTDDRQDVTEIRVGDWHTVEYTHPELPPVVELHPLTSPTMPPEENTEHREPW